MLSKLQIIRSVPHRPNSTQYENIIVSWLQMTCLQGLQGCSVAYNMTVKECAFLRY